MRKPKKPQSQLQEVLYYLLTRISIDRRQMMLSCTVLNLPEQIRRLRENHGLKIDLLTTVCVNKYSRVVVAGEYKLADKKAAMQVYREMQKLNKEVKK